MYLLNVLVRKGLANLSTPRPLPICPGAWFSAVVASSAILLVSKLVRLAFHAETWFEPVLTKLNDWSSVAFQVAGFVSLFIGLLYQRRIQRADELMREMAVLSESMHPDLRVLEGLMESYTTTAETKIDPRWHNKHTRTDKTRQRFREYRQLFQSPSRQARAIAHVFGGLLVIRLFAWGMAIGEPSSWLTTNVLSLLLVAVGTLLVQVYLTLRQTVSLPAAGTDEHLHERMGVPSWYSLLDATYLDERFMPFTSFLRGHALYLQLTEETIANEEHWSLLLQLPLPLRNWSHRLTVYYDGTEIRAFEDTVVNPSATDADRFFRTTGQWFHVRLGAWPKSATPYERFDSVRAEISLCGPDKTSPLTITVSDRKWFPSGDSAKKKSATTREGLLVYPWYEFPPDPKPQVSDQNTWLARPAASRTIEKRALGKQGTGA